MRALFLLILLAGIGAALGYPWAVNNFAGAEIGRYPAYARGGPFTPVSVDLEAGDAPVRVLVDMTALGQTNMQTDRTALTLTAATGGATVLADTLTFASTTARDVNPQLQERIYRDTAGLIDPVKPGTYVFTLGPGDAEDIVIKSVDLILRREAVAVDARIQPVGYALMAVGFIGLVLAFRRRKAAAEERNPNSQPPPPRWGRNGT
jgi:hypothetical protein